ncbi:GNAT family N-acetyltransferase [Microbulbifer taiwanensis]|uniref:GNAT family N-acetyltransferase n=1 Tax=Microbulbifer taiwanensis TaxID=986746 RepID=A0ABW1YHS4_9GAMM|nr:GNAT family N-acetyltransferase [Microbulbifer taiwanensis]
MSEICFRPCQPEDADAAVPLIYSSGPAAFDYVFCDRSEQQSRDFLHHAFIRGRSEFGYRQHIAAVLEDNVVAIGAVRDASQNFPFTVAALRDIFSFYSPLAAARSLTRGLRTELVIQPPKAGAGLIYHLGVAKEQRGRGIGRKLIAELLQTVRARALPVAALDVAESNPRARQLYERLGFSAKSSRQSRLQSNFGRVPDHTHMELVLSFSEQRSR